MAFGTTRTVAVNLKANVSDYIGKVTAAGKATGDFAKNAVTTADKQKAAWDRVGKGMLLTGAAIGAGVVLAVKSYADFEQQLSNVRAVSGATAGEMSQLSDAALSAGQATKYSATQAAEAEAELAKLGVSTADILGGALTGSLNLAAAGNLNLADAATYAGQAMKIFNLNGRDVPHIADVLASGANRSAADVTDLAQALQQGGLVAAQTGLTLEDTVGVLAAFSDNALNGSDAGTSFKTMLQRLNPQSDKAKNLMDKLGLSAYDAGGNFIGITAYAGKLQGALKGMTAEQRNATLQIIFGQDAVRAANVLYKEGAEGIASYVRGVNDQGAAARVAAIQMDNLKGDLEQLRGSIETALIRGGKAGSDALRGMVEVATGAVNVFGQLPGPLQEGAVGFAALASATLLAGGGFLTFAPKVKPALDALQTLRVSTSRISGLLGPLGLAFAAGTVVVGLFAKAQIDAARKASELRATLDQQTGAITVNTREWVANDLQKSGAFDRWAHLAGGVKNLTDAALGNADALAQLHAAQQANDDEMNSLIAKHGQLSTAEYNRLVSLSQLHDAYVGMFKDIGETTSVLNPQITQQKELGEAVGGTASGVNKLADAQQAQADAASAATKAMKDYTDAAVSSGLIVLSERDAVRGFRQALDDAKAALKSNGKTLDTHTQKGRDNQKALDDVAQAARDQAKAIFDSTQKTKGDGPAQKAFRRSLLDSRDALIQTGVRFGLTRKQATDYADSVLNIPPARSTKVTLKGAKAATDAAATLRRQLLAIKDRTVTVDVITRTANKLAANPGLAPGRASGGPVSAHKTYLVGESGPELVTFDKAGTVVPAAQTRSLLEQLAANRYASGSLVTSARATAAAASAGPTYSLGNGNQFFSYDPTNLMREQEKRARDAAAVAGLRQVV